MLIPAVPSVLACLLFTGCALIDQKTFAPAPEAKAQPAAAQTPPAQVNVDPRTPLVTIDFSSAPPPYEELLRSAVRAAETRDRDVQYDVIALFPKPNEADQGKREAAAVMRSMMLAGVPSGRIHLGLRAEPALPGRQVRVYVR